MNTTNSDLALELEFQEKVLGAMAKADDVKNAQIQALTERNEFLEDLIAELAVQAYSKTPNA